MLPALFIWISYFCLGFYVAAPFSFIRDYVGVLTKPVFFAVVLLHFAIAVIMTFKARTLRGRMACAIASLLILIAAGPLFNFSLNCLACRTPAMLRIALSDGCPKKPCTLYSIQYFDGYYQIAAFDNARTNPESFVRSARQSQNLVPQGPKFPNPQYHVISNRYVVFRHLEETSGGPYGSPIF